LEVFDLRQKLILGDVLTSHVTKFAPQCLQLVDEFLLRFPFVAHPLTSSLTAKPAPKQDLPLFVSMLILQTSS
jgi:hypothetical protein